MNRQLLEQPFSAEQIKQRKGTFGNMLDYIEGHAVIKRLNDAFDSEWSFEVIDWKIYEEHGEVVVLGKLTAEGISKFAFGNSKITRNSETNEIVSLVRSRFIPGADSQIIFGNMLSNCGRFFGLWRGGVGSTSRFLLS